MEFEVKELVKIDNGAHTGVIVEVEYRTDPYKYTDAWIEFEEGKRVKYGVPTPTELTVRNKLGRLLKFFGADMTPGKLHDPEKVLVGKKCIFMTMNEEKDGTEYARIVDGSLKPINDDVER